MRFRDRTDAWRRLAAMFSHGRGTKTLVLGAQLVTLGFALAASSCVGRAVAPEPDVSSLVVRNRSVFDVNVYAVPSPVGPVVRLGTVVGTSNASFPLRRHHLQPGGLLAVRLHAIGTRTSWTSAGVAVGSDMLAVLDVSADAFGDCSTSSLYTIVTTDTTDTTARVPR